MAKILITGAAGFIAYHLTQRLAASGHTVVGFDSFNDFYDPALKYHRAQKLYTEMHIQRTIKI
jgi:UDP-glucuronate 4-epimerase